AAKRPTCDHEEKQKQLRVDLAMRQRPPVMTRDESTGESERCGGTNPTKLLRACRGCRDGHENPPKKVAPGKGAAPAPQRTSFMAKWQLSATAQGVFPIARNRPFASPLVESRRTASRKAASAAAVSPRISSMLPRKTDSPDDDGKNCSFRCSRANASSNLLARPRRNAAV